MPSGGCATTAPLQQVYSCQLTATGGTAPYTYSLAGGTALEPGIGLNASTGLISGTPTTPGTYDMQFQACDAESKPVCSAPLTVDPYTAPHARHRH